MFKKSLVLLLALVFLSVFALAGCSPGAPAAPEPAADAPAADAPAAPEPSAEAEYVIRVGHTNAPDHYYQWGLEYFAERVAEKTDGRVEILVFPADQLGGQRQEVEGLMIGTHDMVLVSTMVLSNFEPAIGAFDLPFLFSNREHAFKVLDGEIGDEVAAKFEDQGIKLLAYWENGYRYITNSVRPIVVPEDVRGLKIRVPESPVFLSTFTAMGAAATPMAFGEVFSALQLGTVDGQENPAGHVIHNAFYEVQDYISLTGHFYTAQPLAMSKDLYDSLPADIQQAIVEAAIEARDYERQLSVESEEDYHEQ
ncbi:MAG: TRAP transporter substrate-binding protein, partial [Bacillota bacterium]|nr:TRAP transporter substrate-binding protein [Bacillota bacterium]